MDCLTLRAGCECPTQTKLLWPSRAREEFRFGGDGWKLARNTFVRVASLLTIIKCGAYQNRAKHPFSEFPRSCRAQDALATLLFFGVSSVRCVDHAGHGRICFALV